MTTSPDLDAHQTLYDMYANAWNDEDIEAMAALFVFPIVIGGGGRNPASVPDAGTYREKMREILEDLRARGWTRSVFDEVHMGVMAGDTGVITVRYRREGADGQDIEAGTSNYLTRKIGGAWKMVGILAP